MVCTYSSVGIIISTAGPRLNLSGNVAARYFEEINAFDSQVAVTLQLHCKGVFILTG
jgi:hypothetical protein